MVVQPVRVHQVEPQRPKPAIDRETEVVEGTRRKARHLDGAQCAALQAGFELCSRRHHLAALGAVQGQWLLAVDVLASGDRRQDHGTM